MRLSPVQVRILASCAFASLCIAVAGLWFSWLQRQDMLTSVEAELSAATAYHVQRITAWRLERLSDAETLAGDEMFRDVLDRYLRVPDANGADQVRHRLEVVRKNYRYEDILLLDAEGRFVLSLTQGDLAQPWGEAPEVKPLLGSGHAVMSSVIWREPKGGGRIFVVVPVMGGADTLRKALGYLALAIHAREMLSAFTSNPLAGWHSCETLLVERRNNLAVCLSEPRLVEDTSVELKAPLDRTSLPLVAAALGMEGPAEGLDYRGVPVITFIARPPDTPWSVMAKVDRDEACRPIRLRLLLMLGMALALMLMVATAGWAFWMKDARHAVTRASEQDLRGRRDHLEQLVRERAEQLAYAEKLAHLGSWEQRHGTGEILWSEEMYSILGVPPETGPVTSETYLARVHPDDRASVKKLYQDSLLGGGGFEHSHRIIRQSDGAVLYVHVKSHHHRDGAGNLVRSLGMVRDVTDYEMALQALRESEAKLKAVFRVMPDLSFVLDWDGRYLDIPTTNPDLLYRPFAEVIGRTMHEIFPKEMADLFLGHVRQVLKTGTPATVEYALDIAGKNKMFSARIVFLDATKVLFVGRDITESKQAEVALRDAKEAAEAAARAKSAFLSSMSHELRTPLNAVIGFAEMLADPACGPLNARQAKYVGSVLEAGRHLLEVISDILDLSKIEAGKMVCEPTSILLWYSLDEAVVMMKERAIRHGLALSLAAPRDLVAWTDERMLKQVMLNLLSNAIKFTPAGGGIAVSAEARAGEVVVSVADTGIGIDPRDQQRIFEAFEQVDSSRVRKHEGSGLGLSLVRHFLAMQGGRIWVESEGQGKGSTFRFTLPSSQKDAPGLSRRGEGIQT